MNTIKINDIFNNKISFCLDGVEYSIWDDKIPYFFESEVYAIKNKDEQKKMAEFLLSNTGINAVIESLSLKKTCNICIPIVSKRIKTIEADHDPQQNHKLIIKPFMSLQSIQWHMLSHCITDFWIQDQNWKPEPRILNEKIVDGVLPVLWKKFRTNVNCPRWGEYEFDDFYKRANAVHDFNIKVNNLNNKGCKDCINDHGADIFIKCFKFFEFGRNLYLDKINRWIKDTIQDSKNALLYEGTDAFSESSPNRLHLHNQPIKRYTPEINALVIEENNDEYMIYRMIFALEKRNGNHLTYRIKTVYGTAIAEADEDNPDMLKNEINKSRVYICRRSKYIEHECHSVWNDITDYPIQKI